MDRAFLLTGLTSGATKSTLGLNMMKEGADNGVGDGSGLLEEVYRVPKAPDGVEEG